MVILKGQIIFYYHFMADTKTNEVSVQAKDVQNDEITTSVSLARLKKEASEK